MRYMYPPTLYSYKLYYVYFWRNAQKRAKERERWHGRESTESTEKADRASVRVGGGPGAGGRRESTTRATIKYVRRNSYFRTCGQRKAKDFFRGRTHSRTRADIRRTIAHHDVHHPPRDLWLRDPIMRRRPLRCDQLHGWRK